MTDPISNRRPHPDYQIDHARPRQTTDDPTIARFNLATDHLLRGALTGAATVVAGPAGALVVAGALSGSPPSAGPGTSGNVGAPTTGDPMAEMARIQAEGFQNSAYLLSLQAQIQNENREFTSLTNVLRAKHDTAKAALNNVRS